MVTPVSAVRFADRALVAGHEGHDGSPLWVCRAQQGRDLVPGKYIPKYKQAFIPFNGKEIAVQNIEILFASSANVRWVAAANGTVPARAVPGGRTATGEVLYVGRAPHKNSLTPGKVHASHGCMYISFGGLEHSVKSYEVLCTV